MGCSCHCGCSSDDLCGTLDEEMGGTDVDTDADADEDDDDFAIVRCDHQCMHRMARDYLIRLRLWLLEIEMGVVWGLAGISIICFVFASIWFIDPALLTLVLQFRQARCITQNSAFLVGISNCSWTSCRLGCTREVYKCWQMQVSFEFVSGTKPYRPPWASLSDFERGSLHDSQIQDHTHDEPVTLPELSARLYPNVRGCGYPPGLNCEQFFTDYGPKGTEFDCWVSTLDSSIAMTELDLERAKEEVIYSLVPLFIFIVSVLYAFCRLGVFSICNPLKMCPKANDTAIDMPMLTPKKLYDYKKGLIAKKSSALEAFQQSTTTTTASTMSTTSPPPPAIEEDEKEGEGKHGQGLDIPPTITEDAEANSLSSSTTGEDRRLQQLHHQYHQPLAHEGVGVGNVEYQSSSYVASSGGGRRKVTAELDREQLEDLHEMLDMAELDYGVDDDDDIRPVYTTTSSSSNRERHVSSGRGRTAWSHLPTTEMTTATKRAGASFLKVKSS